MTTLNLDTIKDLYYTEIVYQMHTFRDKISYFTSKYKTDFESFEREMKEEGKENFEKWDDYLEWKGFESALLELAKKKRDLESGDIKVA